MHAKDAIFRKACKCESRVNKLLYKKIHSIKHQSGQKIGVPSIANDDKYQKPIVHTQSDQNTLAKMYH